jgi:hypothetical protein
MAYVTYTGSASPWRTAAYGGITAESGETIEVSDDTAQALVENEDFEHADGGADTDADDSGSEPEFGVLAGSVDDLEAELDDGGHDAHLVALKREEEQHKDRSTAKEAIDERRRFVAENESDDADADAPDESDAEGDN